VEDVELLRLFRFAVALVMAALLRVILIVSQPGKLLVEGLDRGFPSDEESP